MPPTIVPCLLAASLLYFIRRLLVPRTTFENIPGPPRKSFWKGYFHQVFGPYGLKFSRDIVEKYGSVVKLPMPFGYDELLITDPLALRHIIVKDQYMYEQASMFVASNAVTLGVSLLSTLGDHHKKQRKILNPVFSLKHMRDLLPVFYPIAYDLRKVLTEQVRGGTKEIDTLHWLSRTSLEFIGQGGFGYRFDALRDEEATEFGRYIKKLMKVFVETAFQRQFLPWVVDIGSPAFRRKVIKLIPSSTIKEAVEAVDALDHQARMVYEQRKAALENGDETFSNQVEMGKDILSVLLKANMTANESDRLPEEEVIGQVNTFILAGQETTSHALSRVFHLLSENPTVQDRLRDEILSARKERDGADFNYDTLMGLPYLDAVCRETLRLFPPFPMVLRTTTRDVVLPLAWPLLGADGKTEITEIPIKDNTNIMVSIIGANRCKRIWGDDAEEWRPERWLESLPESVAEARMPGVYSSIMTFIGGGRACIGFKFAEMEMKLVLATLLEGLEFRPGQEVEWQMLGIVKPVLKHSADKRSGLLLKVSLLQDKA